MKQLDAPFNILLFPFWSLELLQSSFTHISVNYITDENIFKVT